MTLKQKLQRATEAKYLTLLAVLFRLDGAFPYLHFPDMLTDDTETFQDKIHLHSSVCQVPINFTFLFQEPHTQSNFPFLVKRGLFTTVKLPCNDSLYKSIGSVVVNKTTL
jgi:hypothetical protein